MTPADLALDVQAEAARLALSTCEIAAVAGVAPGTIAFLLLGRPPRNLGTRAAVVRFLDRARAARHRTELHLPAQRVRRGGR
jgi:hypothetical protein